MQYIEEQPVMTLKALNGTLLVFNGRAVIRHNTLATLSTQGIKGDTVFFYDTLTSIEYKKPGLINGYLRFVTPGTFAGNPNAGVINSKSSILKSTTKANMKNMEDPNTVLLSAVNGKIPKQSEQIYHFILGKISEAKKRTLNVTVQSSSPESNNSFSNDQELLNMIQKLTITQRAEIILMIQKMIDQNRNQI